MKIVWKSIAAAASLMLASCGGGGGNAAVSKNFTYGAPLAPTTAEQTAATSAQGAVSSTAGFGSGPTSASASVIAGMADDLASSALGASAIGSAPLAQVPQLRNAMRTAVAADCTVVTANTVTFNNCQQSDSGYTFTLNGTVTATGTPGNGNVTWDIHGGFSGTNQGITVNLNLHQSGTLTVTPTTVVGNSLSEISGSASGNGQSISFGLDTAAVVNLTYNATCVTSGTIEVKRVWSQRPNGATGPQFADVAVKLSWTGCNTVQVEHSM